MGIFEKKEKVTLEQASGTIFVFCISFNGKIKQANLELDESRILSVTSGYIYGITTILLADQIGLKRIPLFMDYLEQFIKSGFREGKIDASLTKISAIKSTKWLLNNASGNNVSARLFSELAKEYLEDLYDGKSYPNSVLELATSDMAFYYSNMVNVAPKIKIID